jgi:hypothetical protein
MGPHLTGPITPPIIPVMRMPGEYTLPGIADPDRPAVAVFQGLVDHASAGGHSLYVTGALLDRRDCGAYHTIDVNPFLIHKNKGEENT